MAVGGLSAAVVIISALALMARTQERRAVSRQLAGTARTQVSADAELGLLLAREAFVKSKTQEARVALRLSTHDARELAALHTGRQRPLGAVFSPDGRTVAAAVEDGTIRLWLWATLGRQVILRGHRRAVNDVAFSRNGRSLVSGGADGTVRVWDVRRRTHVTLRAGGVPVTGVAYGRDGEVAGGDDDGILRVWNAGHAQPRLEWRAHTGAVGRIAFSPDGSQLVSAGQDKAVRVWNLRAGGRPLELGLHDDVVHSAAFSRDGRRVVSGGRDGAIRVWNAHRPGAQPAVLWDPGGPVRQATFSPDGRRILSVGESAVAIVWELGNCQCPSLVIPGHREAIFSGRYSRDGQRIVTTGGDGTVRVWDVASGRAPVVLSGHRDDVDAAGFSADGRRLVTGGNDGTRLWDLRSGRSFVVDDAPVADVAIARDGRRIATAVEKGGEVWMWPARRRARPVVLPGATGDRVRSVAFSRGGGTVAGAAADGSVRLWDARGHTPPHALRGHQGAVHALAFSPDGRHLASGGEDKTVQIWDVVHRRRTIVLDGARGHHGQVWGVAFSPDGTRVASASEDETVLVWEWATKRQPILLQHDDVVYATAFSPHGGRLLATATGDGTVRIWDWARAELLLELTNAHTGRAHDVEFSPDGRWLASAGGGRAVRLDACDVCGPIDAVQALAERRTTRKLTAEERERFKVP